MLATLTVAPEQALRLERGPLPMGSQFGGRMKAFEHLGGYTANPAFAAFHGLSVRAFAMYHERITVADATRPMVDLIRRMTYVAEATSAGLRLGASWALTHPAFSLCRDRYEQCVRFSWLARQSDDREWYRYIADYYLTRYRLKKAFEQSKIGIPVSLDDGLAEAPAYVRERFARWRNTPLDQMARRRDELAGITGSDVDQETLFDFYHSIYRQGSSVSHYDLYSVKMLGLYDGPEGTVLAPDPGMPIVLALHCALFDIVQCAEALVVAEAPGVVKTLDGLIAEWWTYTRRTGLLEEPAKA